MLKNNKWDLKSLEGCKNKEQATAEDGREWFIFE